MNRILKRASVVVAFAFIVLFLFSCQDDETKAVFSLVNGIQQDGCHTISVSSNVDSIDLNEYAQVTDGAKWKLYDSSDMKNEIDKTVSLQSGENTFFVRVKQGGVNKDYTVKIIRKRALTVSFDSNGGSACQAIVIDEGTDIPTPITTRIGYDFVRWNFSEAVDSNIYAIAEWSPKSYTITVNNGTEQTTQTVVFGQEYSISTPSRLGYSFIKLIDSNGKELPLSGVWQKAENISVTAKMKTETYEITYIYNANIPNSYASYTVLDEVLIPVPVHPDGLEFDGWYSDSQLSPDKKVTNIEAGSTGDKTLYAKWNQVVVPEEPTYNIIIDADGYDIDGTTIPIKYGQAYVLPEIPKKSGYDFEAWVYGDIVIPTSGIWSIREDATLTIKWNPKTYSIEYVCDEKTTNPNTVTQFTPESDTISLLDASRPNAEFIGWFDESGAKVTEIPKGTTSKVVLYAKFDIKIYKLTYDANGGTVLNESEEYEKGDSYTLLIPEYHGYIFKGWYNGEALVENGTWEFTEDVTLKAKWEKELYLITYELVGGSIDSGAKKSYTVEDTYTLLKPTREGYVFLGWSEKNSSKVYNDMTIHAGTTGNKIYVANWSEFSYSFSGENAIVTSYIFANNRASVKIPTTINYNGVDYKVTEIGASLFSGMGTRIANKEITLSNGNSASKFSVEIPRTLKKIGKNAFTDCNDVTINVVLDSGVELSEWADTLEVAEGNDQVVDVIKGRRPAIGWSIYQ